MCHRTSAHSSPIIDYRRRFRRHSYTFNRSRTSNRIGLDSRPPLMFNKVVAIQPLHCLDGGCFQMGGSRCSYGRSRSLQQLTHGWIRSERAHLRLEHLDRICHLLYFFCFHHRAPQPLLHLVVVLHDPFHRRLHVRHAGLYRLHAPASV